MNEQRFEELWQRAEGAEHGRRLAEEYPVWRQQQRRTMIVAATLAIMAGIALPLFSPTASDPTYLGVCCNHSGIADSQWANLAEELLLEA